MFDLMINQLYILFYNKISVASLDQWLPRYIDWCQRLIYDALSGGAIFETEFIDDEVVNQNWGLHHFDLNIFRVVGFLEDFAIPTVHPGSGPNARQREFAHDIQRAFYLGYLHAHGLKAHVVFLPIGTIVSVFISE
jgi:hypothetical protein